MGSRWALNKKRVTPAENIHSFHLHNPRIQVAAGFALFLITLIVYSPVSRCGFIWDDDFYVTDNKTLVEPGGLARIWFKVGSTPQYYPLVFTSFWIEQRLWGNDPVGYHIINALLHAGTSIVLWRVLRRLSLPGAWLAAAVFALHPVHVESVAWVTERKNVLSGLLYMSALLSYLRFAAPEGPRRWSWYGLALPLFAAALLSKSVTASLPAVIALLLWWKRSLTRADAVALAPMFVLGAVMGLSTVYLEQHHVGARGEEWDLSAAQRVLVAGRAAWFYAGRVFWPSPLMFIYARWNISAQVWWQYLFPVGAAALVAALWLARDRVGRGPLVAALCFGGTLLPALGFFNVYPFRYSFVADHFQYLASIALIALAVSAAAVRLWPRFKLPAVLLSLLLLTLLGRRTQRQIDVYQNMETLWTDTLRKNPGAWMAHGNLGDYLCDRNRRDEAIRHYEEALKHKDNEPQLYFNLGLALFETGRFAEAIPRYREALLLRPDYPQARVNLGCSYLNLGNVDEAMTHLREAIRQDPNLAAAHYNLGNALAQQGQTAEALRSYQEALRCKPDYVEAWINQGNALLTAKKIDEGIAAYRRALTVNADAFEARLNLGGVLSDRGQLEEALIHLNEAVRLRPDSLDARCRLGLVLAASGRREAAILELERVLKQQPNHPIAIGALAKLRATSGSNPKP